MSIFQKKQKQLNQTSLAQIFISYSRKDIQLIENILSELRKKDYRIWVDTNDILPNSEWWDVILHAINDSTIILQVLSNNSLKSEICKKELEYALKIGKKIIFLVIDDFNTELATESIKKYQWVKWKYEDDIEKNMSKLWFALNMDLNWHTLRTTLSRQTEFWKTNNETKDVLLRGDMLLNAERWLDDSYRDKNKLISYDHRRFILKSRKAIANSYLLPLLNGFALVILLVSLMNQIGAPLETPVTPRGIIHLQLANSKEEAEFILSTWRASSYDLIDVAIRLTILNFVYIYTYLLFLIYTFKYLITYFKYRRRLLSTIGNVLLSIVIIAGILDFINTIFLTNLIQGIYLNVATFVNAINIIKFTLMNICLFYVGYSFLYIISLKKRIESIETHN